MKSSMIVCALAALCIASAPLAARPAADAQATHHDAKTPDATRSVTKGSVTVEGKRINYTATAGTIILRDIHGRPIGSMFYVAYVKDGVKNPSDRPVTFFYNGGPGSSTLWLHMGAFGPQRIVTADHTHTPPGPYHLTNNDYSLLDVTDEVFIDMMSTGYSRILGKDQGGVGKWQDFYGVDPDVKSFAQFIQRYLNMTGRSMSPKYLYGESYGTLRSEVLANYLQKVEDIDLNGVVLQSAYMGNAVPRGSDIQYATDLPTMAADAWYHKKLPNQPAELQPFLAKVEQFATNEYLLALTKGNTLDAAERKTIIQKLHDFTGLSEAYLDKANLRVTPSEFFHELLNGRDLTVGRLDGRFAQTSMDPLSQGMEYDTQAASISSAYAAGFNYYAHNVLKYGRGQLYRPEAYGIVHAHPWSQEDENLATRRKIRNVNGAINLAQALKFNPHLRVEVEAGYYDFATPFYGMVYGVDHMDIPKDLQSHVQFKYYESGHMIYVRIPDLKQLHDNVATFMGDTHATH
jgi:carboxypeptidase C (cathepsin A)